MSTKTVTEKYKDGKLVERTTVETFDPLPQYIVPNPYYLYGGGVYTPPAFKVSHVVA